MAVVFYFRSAHEGFRVLRYRNPRVRRYAHILRADWVGNEGEMNTNNWDLDYYLLLYIYLDTLRMIR